MYIDAYFDYVLKLSNMGILTNTITKNENISPKYTEAHYDDIVRKLLYTYQVKIINVNTNTHILNALKNNNTGFFNT